MRLSETIGKPEPLLTSINKSLKKVVPQQKGNS